VFGAELLDRLTQLLATPLTHVGPDPDTHALDDKVNIVVILQKCSTFPFVQRIAIEKPSTLRP
jgi:hypothetical protein